MSLTLAAFDFASLFTAENMIALVTLTALEIVLGIDNIVFIAVLCARLPEQQRDKARRIGLALALITRLLLLTTLTLIIGAAKVTAFELPWFKETIMTPEGEKQIAMAICWRDVILLVGGAFLIFKATKEIHHKMEDPDASAVSKQTATYWGVITQILIIDLVFSLDSVITAVGMAQALWVMITAVVISVGLMLIAAKPISDYVERHPTVKMLALAFLLMIGIVLVADGLHQHISKGYVYFAMAFSFLVEMLNLRATKKRLARQAAEKA